MPLLPLPTHPERDTHTHTYTYDATYLLRTTAPSSPTLFPFVRVCMFVCPQQWQVYSILVVALFLATELYPFVSALDNEVLLAMSADEVGRGVGISGNRAESGGSRCAGAVTRACLFFSRRFGRNRDCVLWI